MSTTRRVTGVARRDPLVPGRPRRVTGEARRDPLVPGRRSPSPTLPRSPIAIGLALPARPVFDARFAKLLVNVCGTVPLAILLWDAYRGSLGVNGVNYAIRSTGMVGLVCLTLSLVITPLRRLAKWNTLIAVRRNIGVFGALYIATHFLIFFWFDRERSLGSTLEEIVTRVYLWFGTGSLLILIALAVTSTDGMVTRLGAKRWKLLHRLTYVAIAAGVVHFYLLVKADHGWPIAFGIAVGALFAYRIAAHYFDLHAEVASLHGKLRVARKGAKAGTNRPFWSGELRVARIFRETPDVKTFRFVATDGGPLPFQHVAGQYLNIALPIGGVRVHRSYTIASSPTRASYCEISVKRAADGYASHYLHDVVAEGDLVTISAPAGKFVFAGHEAERIVLVAGGVGITPMMSVVRSLTDRGWPGRIDLVFGVRTRTDVIFESELAYLQQRFPNLHVTITLSEGADADPTWTGARGRITRELFDRVTPGLSHGPILLCGPGPMMVATRALLVEMGVPTAEIHEEAFVSPPGTPTAASTEVSAAAAATAPAADGEPAAIVDEATVTFARSATTTDLPASLTVLEAAEDAGVEIPFECRSGICGQCKCKLVSGSVAMAVQDALSAADRAGGLILACQARATTATVVIDA